MRNLSRGDRGKEVLDVQTRLRGQGFELGREGVDGFFGPQHRAAVRSFQQERGLLADGVVGANTWRELVEAGYALGDRLLYLREPPFRGDDVLALQVKLNLLGFNAGAERGVHDDEVERAVLDFQRNAGLPARRHRRREHARQARGRCARRSRAARARRSPSATAATSPARGLTGQTVVIDPGHGGADARRRLAAGLAEKDVALALGLRLAELLRAEGCRVQLTRERDERVPLYARADAANGAGADFFLSLHCNADDAPAAARRRLLLLPAQPLLLRARAPAGRVHRRPPRGRRRPVPRQLRAQLRACCARRAAIAVLVEPLFLSNPEDEAPGAAARPRRDAGAGAASAASPTTWRACRSTTRRPS